MVYLQIVKEQHNAGEEHLVTICPPQCENLFQGILSNQSMVADYIIIIIENFVCHLDLLVDVFLFFPLLHSGCSIFANKKGSSDLAIASARNFDCFQSQPFRP